MNTHAGFSPKSFVLARLLVQPVYREDGALWDTLRAERDSITHYFRQIGQEVVVDEAEGYAFLRQKEATAYPALVVANPWAIQRLCFSSAYAKNWHASMLHQETPRDWC